MRKIIKILTVFALIMLTRINAFAIELIPVGTTVGIELQTKGLMVIGLSEVETENGKCRPAEKCGIQAGDIIVNIDGKKISATEDFKEAMENCDKAAISVAVERQGEVKNLTLQPAKSTAGNYELGLWLRDGISGIGTVTFYDPENEIFGALGHAVNDADTGTIIPVKTGNITFSNITSVLKGKSGNPGELQGCFDKENPIGTVIVNTPYGIFGSSRSEALKNSGKTVETAGKSEIETGEASILSNIEGSGVEEFKAEIIKVYEGGTHDLMIKVCDERLLEKTGGIVQGMSGSPILQNGKLIGAVTHVLVNDPTRGYGISIENMLSALNHENKN